MKDTPPGIERKFRKMLLERSGQERLKMGCSMHATAQALAKASISQQHPGAHPAQFKRLLFLHFYGTDFEPKERKRIASALARNVRADGRGRKLPMKIEYDAEHDLLNIEFLANVPIDDSLEVDGVVIDYAKDKRIVAIEVLDASKRTTRKPLDLIDLAIVKSSGSDAVRERGETYGRAAKVTAKRSRQSSQ